MNRFAKCFAALTLAGAVVLSSTGCADISTVGTIDGENIRAGVYLMYELQAISEANTEIDEQLTELGQSASDIENFSYFNYNVQEKPYSQFVEERTLGYIKRHIAIQRRFDELKLELTDEETSTIRESAADMWDTEMTYYGYGMGQTYGEYYENLGVSRASYQEMQLVDLMSNKLFDSYYDENGTTPTDENDIKTYYEDNYGRFQIIQVSLTEGDGSKIETDEGKKKMEDLANGYLDRLKDGEDFDTVYHDYEDYVAKQKEQAEKDSEDTSESSEVSSAEETVGDSAAPEEEEEHDHETLLSKDSTTPSEEFIKWAFELDEDEGGLYKDETVYYAVMRKKLLERDDWYETNRSSVLHIMKDEEFEGVLDEIAKNYDVQLNNAALDAYKPDKIHQ